MKTTIKAGSKVTTTAGKVYMTTGEASSCGGVDYLHVEPTEENNFRSRIEFWQIASVEAA